MGKAKFIAIVLVLFASLANADDWVAIGKNDNLEGFILKNSFEIKTTRGGVEVAMVTTRTYWKKTNEVELGRSYVSINDCLRKQGKVVVLDMNNNFSYENDFIFGAGSIATDRAEWICAVYFRTIEEANKKGV